MRALRMGAAACCVVLVSCRADLQVSTGATTMHTPQAEEPLLEEEDERIAEQVVDAVERKGAAIDDSGRFVAYLSNEGRADSTLYVWDGETRSKTRLVSFEGRVTGLRFSMDGDSVYYLADVGHDRRSALYRIGRRGGVGPIRIAEPAGATIVDAYPLGADVFLLHEEDLTPVSRRS